MIYALILSSDVHLAGKSDPAENRECMVLLSECTIKAM
jgi:hypothetical protein